MATGAVVYWRGTTLIETGTYILGFLLYYMVQAPCNTKGQGRWKFNLRPEIP
ncbi:MAG: hypothetical protein RHS_0277 [Robinsoniella sp. RHS]|nr:MAG: hypothetical protein RHS_0277 [Robinsoniella sp. RHS]